MLAAQGTAAASALQLQPHGWAAALSLAAVGSAAVPQAGNVLGSWLALPQLQLQERQMRNLTKSDQRLASAAKKALC